MQITNTSQTSFITTQYGTQITFDDIRPEMLKAREIAWHLAWKCRYNGFMHHWYSNAEHCILGLEYCDTLETKRRFLIHDAGELITGDVPSPFKRRCPDYQKACDMIQRQVNWLICPIYDHDVLKATEERVKYADLRVTAAEQKFIRNQPPDTWVAEPPPIFKYYEWTRGEAYHHWLLKFKELFPEWTY